MSQFGPCAPPRGGLCHSLLSSLPSSHQHPAEAGAWRLAAWSLPWHLKKEATGRGDPINTLYVCEVWLQAGFGLSKSSVSVTLHTATL